MPVTRNKPLHQQIADHYAGRITAGDLKPGTRLPTIQALSAEWQVSHQTAVRAMELLRSRKLVATTRDGSVVGTVREVSGPQQWLTATRFPDAALVVLQAAELIPAPEYVAPILGVSPYGPGGAAWVIRREQVSYEEEKRPFLLTVQWFPGRLAEPVPALLAPAPLAPGESAALIAVGSGQKVARWTQATETRQILDDGREGPLLGLPPGSYVQAGTYTWADATDVFEYGEYCLIPDRVITSEYATGATD